MTGLAKLKKRVDDGSVVICETDKSGKLAIVTMEEYIRMGQVHIEKDTEIDQDEVDRKERLLNGHTSMLLKLTNTGQVWDHESRHRESLLALK